MACSSGLHGPGRRAAAVLISERTLPPRGRLVERAGLQVDVPGHDGLALTGGAVRGNDIRSPRGCLLSVRGAGAGYAPPHTIESIPGGKMYATQVSVRIETGREDEARQGLVGQVLPRVKGSPGFVAGYWLAPEGNVGSSIVFWETKQHADAMAAQLQPGSHPAPPVTVELVEVREVIENI